MIKQLAKTDNWPWLVKNSVCWDLLKSYNWRHMHTVKQPSASQSSYEGRSLWVQNPPLNNPQYWLSLPSPPASACIQWIRIWNKGMLDSVMQAKISSCNLLRSVRTLLPKQHKCTALGMSGDDTSYDMTQFSHSSVIDVFLSLDKFKRVTVDCNGHWCSSLAMSCVCFRKSSTAESS